MTDPHQRPSAEGDLDDQRRAFIDFMVRCDVLTFGDFVGKSGRRMPYFVNAGRYRTGAQLAQLGRFYADALDASFGAGFDVVFGPAYKGIPLAVTTAISLSEVHGRDVAYCFDRKEIKDHGEGGQLVGHQLRDGDRVVIVEDVTTAGTSIKATVPLLRSIADVEVVGLVVGVDRRERGTQTHISALDELSTSLGLTTVSLATIDDVIAHLADHEVGGQRVLGDDDLARIAAYRAEHGPVSGEPGDATAPPPGRAPHTGVEPADVRRDLDDPGTGEMTFVDLDVDDARWASALSILKELRPHLDEAGFREVYQAGRQQGLTFTGAFASDGGCLGVAGWRVVHNTSAISELYVDDLVVAASQRSTGVGGALLAHLEGRGTAAGCRLIELDSGRQRIDAHRFYRREGYEDTGLHFVKPLDTA